MPIHQSPRSGSGSALAFAPTFCQSPGARFLLYYWGMTVHGGVCRRVEGVCDRVEYSVVRSMENGVQWGSAWRGYCYVELYKLGPGWVRTPHDDMHRGCVDTYWWLEYISFFFLPGYVLGNTEYYVTISVYKFYVLGVQGPSCGLAFGLSRRRASYYWRKIPQYHLFG